MFLNTELLIKLLEERISEEAEYEYEVSYISDVNELHDIGLLCDISNIAIEEYDMVYWDMVSLLNIDGEDILDCINMFIDDNFQSYYLDPAFSSSSDYWGYILGR